MKLTLTITYIAFVQKEGTNGATIAFPAGGHGLEIFVDGQQVKGGGLISLEVLDRFRVPIHLGETKGLPMAGRVLSMDDLADGGGPYSLKSDMELLTGGLAQTVLRVHGGEFRAMPPHTSSQYKDDKWRIRSGNEKEVTDQVEWALHTDKDYGYFLIIDGRREPLSPTASVQFTNDDQPRKYFYDNGEGFAELLDVHELYKMVTPAPLKRPTPKAPYKGPFIPPGPAGSRGAIVFGGGDLPLCPVGEP